MRAVDLPLACGLPEGDLECLVALTVANFFGWYASSVFSVPLTAIQRGPDEWGHPTIEFGTSVFKASPLYPGGRLALQELPGLFKVVLTFVVARKGQREREFLFGPLESARGQAAAWLAGCVRRVNHLYGLHLPLESHALKRGAASCLDAL